MSASYTPEYIRILSCVLWLALGTVMTPGCITIHQHQPTANPQVDDVITTALPRDTTYSVASGGMEIVAGVPGKESSMRLAVPGDSVVIHDNELVALSFAGLDPKSSVIVTEYDQASGKSTIRVVDRTALSITFTEKCQVFRVGNVATLSRVVISPSLQAEQIVVTPLCDGKQNIVGYEYRYGSQESGCREQARQGIREWHRCKTAKPVEKRRSKRVSDEDASIIYFGI